MDHELLIIASLTYVIHLIATLAYSVRIAGTRTGRVAISLALFNILILVSRTSNALQAPLLAKRVEERIIGGALEGGLLDFRILIAAASLATLTGALLVPTFQRMFTKAVEGFSMYQSVPALLIRALSPKGLVHMRTSMKLPGLKSVFDAMRGDRISANVILFNGLAVSIFTVGVLASIYAGYINPELRATSGQMSAVVNGIATILLFIFIDPHLSMVTDEVVKGERSSSYLRRSVVWLVGSRLVGTLLAQVLLIPGARWVVFIAELL